MESVPSCSLPLWDALDAKFDFTEQSCREKNGLTSWKKHSRRACAKKALRAGARSGNRSSDCVAGW